LPFVPLLLFPAILPRFYRFSDKLLVENVIAAVANYAAQGCRVLVEPFDIAIGKCAVIADPFGTRLCILDMTKGTRQLDLAGLTIKE
jgi:hypothetical protein